MKKAPVHKIRMGSIHAAIWRNEGKSGPFYSTTISRAYRDGNDWKQTESFNRDDLPLVTKLADRAHSWIFDQQQPETS